MSKPTWSNTLGVPPRRLFSLFNVNNKEMYDVEFNTTARCQ